MSDLPKATLGRLVDDYFRYSHNQLYSFFHEDTFRLKSANGTIPEYLLETVIVSSLRFSRDPYFEDDLFFLNKRKVTADAFARKSWNTLSSKFVDGDDDCCVEVVQAVTLLAIYEFIGLVLLDNSVDEKHADLASRRQTAKCLGQDWHRSQICSRPSSYVRAGSVADFF